MFLTFYHINYYKYEKQTSTCCCLSFCLSNIIQKTRFLSHLGMTTCLDWSGLIMIKYHPDWKWLTYSYFLINLIKNLPWLTAPVVWLIMQCQCFTFIFHSEKKVSLVKSCLVIDFCWSDVWVFCFCVWLITEFIFFHFIKSFFILLFYPQSDFFPLWLMNSKLSEASELFSCVGWKFY